MVAVKYFWADVVKKQIGDLEISPLRLQSKYHDDAWYLR